MKSCPACILDPDPRGPSACAACRELNRRAPHFPDLSEAHVERVARHLYRVFDDAVCLGREPSHDFDVMAEGSLESEDPRPVIDGWRALARAAIQLGAIIPAGIP